MMLFARALIGDERPFRSLVLGGLHSVICRS